MYLIREVVHCKPGRVRAMVEKLQALGEVMEGYHDLVREGRREIYVLED